MIDKPLTVQELAEYLGVSVSWVQKQCAARTIPHSRVARQIRFTAEHIEQILDAGEQPVARAAVVPIRVRRAA